MSNMQLDVSSGKISIDGHLVAPMNLSGFECAIKANGIEAQDCTRNEGWPTFGLEVKIDGQEFWMNISFKGNELYSVWLSWNGGISEKKGYDTTERELISDKNALSKFLSRKIGKQPEVKDYNRDIFLFDWGYVSASASLQSVMVSVGIAWQPWNQNA